jgi:hypothetical protein
VYGDARSAEAWSHDDDELYAWGDEEEGEDKGGVFEFVGEEVKIDTMMLASESKVEKHICSVGVLAFWWSDWKTYLGDARGTGRPLQQAMHNGDMGGGRDTRAIVAAQRGVSQIRTIVISSLLRQPMTCHHGNTA